MPIEWANERYKVLNSAAWFMSSPLTKVEQIVISDVTHAVPVDMQISRNIFTHSLSHKDNVMSDDSLHAVRVYEASKARFPLPELTARVDW